jgi:hypothetical protein
MPPKKKKKKRNIVRMLPSWSSITDYPKFAVKTAHFRFSLCLGRDERKMESYFFL